MDEVYFHLNQRLEHFQIWLSEVAESLGSVLEDAMGSEAMQRLRDGGKEALSRAMIMSYDLRQRLCLVLRPELLIGKISSLLGPDLNRATLYAGCIGFTIGSGLGIALGVCLQSPAHPQTLMKAVAATSFTGTDSIVILEDAQVPLMTSPDDVLIEVRAASLDVIDLRVSSGYARTLRRHYNRYNPNCRGELPVVLGRDGAGVVIDVGSNVVNVDVGDSVYFFSPPWLSGTLSEYVSLPSSYVSRKPSRIGFEGAAALPTSGVDAWCAVTKRAGMTTKNAHTKRVLVHSGSTGAGWLVVQMCATLGAAVVATCHNRSAALMRTLGAAQVVPLESSDAEETLLAGERFDVVFNTAGTLAHEFCLSACKRDGLVVSTVPRDLLSDDLGLLLSSLYSLALRLASVLPGEQSGERVEALRRVSGLVDSGRVRPLVDRLYAHQELEEALARTQSSARVGASIFTFGAKTERPRDRPDLIS